MTIRDLIKILSDADLDKKIDVAAWREEKKKTSINFSDTEKAFFRGFVCRDSRFSDSNINKTKNLTPELPIPDAGASMRELFSKITDLELDADIDDKIAEWRKKHSYEDRAYLRFFIQKKGGKNFIQLAEVEISDKGSKIDKTDDNGTNSKNKDNSYIPILDDFENTRRKLLREGKKSVSTNKLLDIMQNDIEATGCKLSENWRSVTLEKIKKWSKKY